MTREPIGVDEVRAGLAAVEERERNLAYRLVTPWWYHPPLGALEAALALCLASASIVAIAVGTAVFGAGVGIPAQAYQRLAGAWVSGFRGGRPGVYAAALELLAPASLVVAAVAGRTDAWWLAIVAAIVGTTVLGRAFDAALRADLRRGR